MLDALLALLCVAVTLLVYRVTFLTNDDAAIQYTLSGCYTGAPFPVNGFIGLPIGWFAALLYRLLPAVPWWACLLLLGASGSVYALNRMVTRGCMEAKLPIYCAPVVNALLYWTVYVYAVSRLSFTMTACMLGAAGVACVLSAPADERLGARGVWGVALMLLCFFFRNSTGLSMLCFFLAAICYRVLSALLDAPRSERKKRVVNTLLFALAGAALFACAVALNSWKERALNPPGYVEFEEARGRYFDYPHVSYGDDPAFFEALGWDETIYQMADNMCFFDERITAERMNAVLAYPKAQAGLLSRLIDALEQGERFFRGAGAAQYMLVVPVLLTLWTLVLRPRERGRGRAALVAALAVAAGSFMLCLYLCFKERLILRAFQVIAVPASVFILRMLLLRIGFMARGGCRGVRRAAGVALLLATICALGWSAYKTNAALAAYDPDESMRDMRAVEAYAMAHPDNVYVYSPRMIYNVEAFKAYPGKKPTNLIDWGNAGMHSAWKDRQIARNGLSSLNADIFMRDNVYLLGTAQASELTALTDYLYAHAGAERIEQADGIGTGFAAFRVIFAGDEADG